MKVENYLSQRRSAILKKWLDQILDTYPDDAKRFLKEQKDPFANPVGSTISKEIHHLYDEFLKGADPEKMSPILDRIIRIRAIQDFLPSQAIAFIFILKGIIRDEFKSGTAEGPAWDDLMVIENRIDRMALLGFDIYMACREKLYEIRAKEEKNQVSGLLKRAGLIVDINEAR